MKRMISQPSPPKDRRPPTATAINRTVAVRPNLQALDGHAARRRAAWWGVPGTKPEDQAEPELDTGPNSTSPPGQPGRPCSVFAAFGDESQSHRVR